MKCILAFAIAAIAGLCLGAEAKAVGRSFEVRDGNFWLNGAQFQILGGEMHMSRIPRAYWRQRLKMARAMGLNAIGLYIFWNVHETEKGKFDFKGEKDVAQFCRIAAEEGLWVCLRPGPYVCAEWDFGGFPYWLLTEPGCVPRSNNPVFLQYSARYMSELGKQLAPLQADRGGNIIMVQVENEYGSYGNDKKYMAAIRDQIRAAGFTVPLYTADGATQMPNGMIEGALPGNNGADSPELKDAISKFAPSGPFFCPEWYPGWLCHWGEKFPRSNTASDVAALEAYLRNGHSINLYMFHGGTNFGFWNGANYGAHFEPHITSYDYDAPLDEAGRATDEYMKMRAAIERHIGKLPPVPPANPVIRLDSIAMEPICSAVDFAAYQPSVTAAVPMPMENLGQGYGFTLYESRLAGPKVGTLVVSDVRDFAVVMLDGLAVGTLDRRRKESTLQLNVPKRGASVQILVENAGRINYGGELLNNLKGITKSVTFDGEVVRGWKMTPLPFKMAPRPKASMFSLAAPNVGNSRIGPKFYRGSFSVEKRGDTWLDMRAWGKGVVWVNGHSLGRYWAIGPQQTLYLPGCWLNAGKNEIILLELLDHDTGDGINHTELWIDGLDHPILDQPRLEPPLRSRPPRQQLVDPPQPEAADRIAGGEFGDSPGPKDVAFKPKTARYIALKSLSAIDGSNYASCAEIIALDPKGKQLSRSKWKILYADSEERDAEDGSAANLLDGDVETIWHSEWSQAQPKHPHLVVIDMGADVEIGGLRYVPRPGARPGRIKGYAWYLSREPFGAR